MPRLLLVLILGLLVGVPSPAAAQSGARAVGPTDMDSDAVRVPDVALVDHEGEPVRFATDVIGGRLVMGDAAELTRIVATVADDKGGP